MAWSSTRLAQPRVRNILIFSIIRGKVGTALDTGVLIVHVVVTVITYDRPKRLCLASEREELVGVMGMDSNIQVAYYDDVETVTNFYMESARIDKNSQQSKRDPECAQ
ncbi:hypothetical protein BDY19DRAFT_902483 [Irpex rosettiformis]|uniref:Uncharacterized protein n=1 Tax=Irpex rosettiformis TaxID=378272 RepID=A0ACB8UHM5_9APHY|nr:hypothetical protein BDY19DRAFT_902483 [Irpex rosettiformis]